MSQLEGGRAQAGFIRSGGGNIQRQQIGSLDVRPLAVTPAVSASANQLAQASETLAAFASTVKEGGRYAEWLRTQREAEAERQRLAMANEMKRVDAISAATEKASEAEGSIYGRAAFAETLDAIKSGRLVPPSDMDGPEQAEWVRSVALSDAQQKVGDKFTDAFARGLAKELDPKAILDAAYSERDRVAEESANSEVDYRANLLVGLGNDPKMIEGVVAETVKLAGGVLPEDKIRKRVVTPAIQRAADEGKPDKVRALAASLNGAEEAFVLEQLDKAVANKKKADDEFQSQAKQTALKYLTDQVDLSERTDPGIVDYIEFASERGVISADDRKEYLGRIKKLRETQAERQQDALDESTANNAFAERLLVEGGKVTAGRWWEAQDVEVKVGKTTRKADVKQIMRAVYEDGASKVDATEGLGLEDRTRLKSQYAFRLNYVPESVVAKGKAVVQKMQALGQAAAGTERIVPDDDMKEMLAWYEEARKLSPSFAEDVFKNDSDRIYFGAVAEYLRSPSSSNDLKGAINYANSARSVGPVNNDLVTKATKGLSNIEGYDFVGGEIAGHVAREARINMAKGMAPDAAVEQAAKVVDSRLINANGYSTYVTDRAFNVQDKKAFDFGVRAWANEIAAKVGNRPENMGGVNRDQPLKAEDIRLRQDATTGLWVVMDARPGGGIIATSDDLTLSALTTQEIMSKQMGADARARIEQANEAKAKRERRSVDISASSDTGSGTF